MTQPIIQRFREKFPEFVESGANLEHDRWARWQKWVHQVYREGKFEEFMPRWERQIATPYADLSEEEKESDRKETRNYIPLLLTELQREKREMLDRIEKEIEGRIDKCGGCFTCIGDVPKIIQSEKETI